MRRAITLAVLACACLAGPARADIWGYVDAQGVAHFASEQVDPRYELFFRGGESFDTRDGVQAPSGAAAAPLPLGNSRLATWLEVSPGYKSVRHHLREAAREHGIDYELLKALIATESGFNAAAISPKGAVGLMQVMPATAQRYGVRGDAKAPVEKKLADPRTNIRAGARYLADLLRMFPGQLELALAAYNAGEGAVQRAGNRIPNYRETRNYVKTVLQLYGALKPPGLPDLANRSVPSRVRMELPAPPGGAVGRGNLPRVLPPPAAAPQPQVTASEY